MSRSVATVVVCTLLALPASAARVPTFTQSWVSMDNRPPPYDFGEFGLEALTWRWAWDATLSEPTAVQGEAMTRSRHVYWPFVFGQFAFILLIGGGLLTFVVRRERRKQSGAGRSAA